MSSSRRPVVLYVHGPPSSCSSDLVGGEELSDAERDQLLQLCRQRVRETGFSES